LKKLSLVNKIIFGINSLFAMMLLLSYILPYVAPNNFAILAVLSLAVPFLILTNLLFLLYWLMNVKKQLFLSLFVLILGFNHVSSLYNFSNSKDVKTEGNLSIMNYNVRLFDLYNWINLDNVQDDMVAFIKNESPDIISFQEYHPHEKVDLSFYKYKYEELSGVRVKYGQAIFSKFPIVNSGSIEFPDTGNNAIFADIVKDKDTIRVYNVHLQSLRIDAEDGELSKENSGRLIKRASETFKMQQFQSELFLLHKNKSPHKMIICGDFNNTAYSYVYKEIKGELIDAFGKAGNGFGRTFDFKYFPVRIDFILTDKAFKINHFKTYDVKFSDHFPVLTKVSLH
jgi:endonuclease/exonuclease/phosphatase family metal-dependent hydrolase